MTNTDRGRHRDRETAFYLFTQQRLPACKPVLTPAWVITIFLFTGFIFIPLGLITLHASRSVVEIVEQYDSECVPEPFRIDKVSYIQDDSIPKNCSLFLKSGTLFTGGESRSITAWDTKSGKVAYCIEDAHSARVKGIVVLTKDGGVDDAPYLVASASSDGFIRVWDVRMAFKGKPNPLAEANTKSRLTCLAGSSLKSSKRPQIGKNAPKEELDAAEEV